MPELAVSSALSLWPLSLWLLSLRPGSVDGVTAGTLAAMEEFCVVSCDAGVADFLLLCKSLAAPKSEPVDYHDHRSCLLQ